MTCSLSTLTSSLSLAMSCCCGSSFTTGLLRMAPAEHAYLRGGFRGGGGGLREGWG